MTLKVGGRISQLLNAIPATETLLINSVLKAVSSTFNSGIHMSAIREGFVIWHNLWITRPYPIADLHLGTLRFMTLQLNNVPSKPSMTTIMTDNL